MQTTNWPPDVLCKHGQPLEDGQTLSLLKTMSSPSGIPAASCLRQWSETLQAAAVFPCVDDCFDAEAMVESLMKEVLVRAQHQSLTLVLLPYANSARSNTGFRADTTCWI